MKKLLALTLALVMLVAALVSCSGQDLKFGKEYVAADTQMNVLVQLNAKSVDVGIMDSVMANYYLTQDTTYANALALANITLAEEEYGIAARKGSGLIKAINAALVQLAKTGDLAKIAAKYGLQNDLLIDADTKIDALTDEEKVDFEYIVGKKKVVIGYTEFAPIAYKEDGVLTGFDIDLAKAVFELLNLEAEFVIINWNTKEAELESKSIDCIWNGMTINEERLAAMEISLPYLKNKQAVLVRKEDVAKYTTTEDMAEAIICAEKGSAGEDCCLNKD